MENEFLIYKENFFWIILYPLLVTSFLILILYFYFPKLLSVSISNEKTSVIHKNFFRGYGIIFPISIFPSFLIFKNFFSLIDISYLVILTFLGYLDDKINLNYKIKFFVISLCSIIYILFLNDLSEYDFSLFVKIITQLIIFIFFILLFNQIDGINGLAAITFLIAITFITLIYVPFIYILPTFFTMLTYFGFNISGKFGIQGDAGSFFLGSFFIILLSKQTFEENLFLFLFVLSPVLYDVVATTLIRLLFKENIFKGHKNNLYQKLAAYKSSHLFSTLIFAIIQIFLCIIYFILAEILETKTLFFILSAMSIIIFLFFLVIAYLIQTKNIMSKVN